VDVIGLIAGSGWASGLNLYLVALVLGMAGRLGLSEVPPVLMRTDVLVVTAVLFFVEFAADKIPYVDNVWDAIHTVVRPVGAAALGYVIAGESGSIAEAVGALIAGSLAATAHSAKATTRAAVNVSPEPVSNVALSVTEDVMASGLTVMALVMPVVAIVVVVLLAVGSVVVAAKLWATVARISGRLRERRNAPR
jgi:hypothetical protein